MKSMLCLLCLLCVLCAGVANADELRWQREHAPRWQAVVGLYAAGTYVDFTNRTHVIEVDRADNWYEAVGQSLWYVEAVLQEYQMERKPGIILLRSSPRDARYINRCKAVCERHSITLWVEDLR